MTRREFILQWRFATYYDTEQAWQRDFESFKSALKQFDGK